MNIYVMDHWISAYMIWDSLKAHMPLELTGTKPRNFIKCDDSLNNFF